MSLIEETVLLMREANDIKKEYEPVVNLITDDKSVHLSFYDGLTDNLNQFVDLADGRKVTFEDRGDSDYPYKAFFKVDKVKFFILLLDGQKEKLESLIVAKQVHDFIEDMEAMENDYLE